MTTRAESREEKDMTNIKMEWTDTGATVFFTSNAQGFRMFPSIV